jgi:cell division protein FtsB
VPTRRPAAPRGARRPGPPGGTSRVRGTATSSGPAAPSGSRRPGTAARPRSSQPAEPRAPRGLTRRAGVLAVLLLVAAAVVAPYLRSFAEQQAQLATLHDEVAERRREVADLEAQLQRWDDPAFVMARARERLFMVMPGETGYVVLDPPSPQELAAEDPAATARAATAAAAGSGRPWYGTLWESVQLAGAEVDGAAQVDGAKLDGAQVPAPPTTAP